MDDYVLIRSSLAWKISVTPPDIVAIPDDASLFSDLDWSTLATAAGNEDVLLQQLGVTYAQAD